MSVLTSEVTMKEYLVDHDTQYRDLLTEHHKYDERLNEIASLPHPSQEEQLEEILLKKQKLFLKDQMEMIAVKYKTAGTGH